MSEYIDTFKRVEHKYLLTGAQAEEIRERLAPYLREDCHPRYTLNNIYYDSPDSVLIRRSLMSPEYKEKLRLRCYGEPDETKPVFPEIKKKFDGIVYKRRIEMTHTEALRYFAGLEMMDASHGQIGREIDYMVNFYDVVPKLFIRYDREAFAGVYESDVRVTFDTNILWREDHVSLATRGNEKQLLGEDQVLMEIKVMDRYPLWLTKELSEMKLYRTNFSKYGKIYALQNQRPAGTHMHYSYESLPAVKEERACLVQF